MSFSNTGNLFYRLKSDITTFIDLLSEVKDVVQKNEKRIDDLESELKKQKRKIDNLENDIKRLA